MQRQAHGITLLELLIVIVIIGILASIAYPHYLDRIRQARRVDGQAALLEAQARMERCFTQNSTYTDCPDALGLPLESSEGYYRITANVPTPTSFSLTATPQGDQTNDAPCAGDNNMTVNQINQRLPLGCW